MPTPLGAARNRCLRWVDRFVRQQITISLARSRVVVLLGPRQCGKTTLARQFVAIDSVNYFDLEDPAGRARLDQPMTALQDLRGLVVIDEIQRRPDLFPVLRVPCDRTPGVPTAALNSIYCCSKMGIASASNATARMRRG